MKGLELGADEIRVVKPSSAPGTGRTRAVLRRADATPATSTSAGDGALQPGSLTQRSHAPRLAAHPPDALEARLLETLLLNAGHVLTAEALVDAVWGAEGGDRAMLKQLVYRCAAKSNLIPPQPFYIETVPPASVALDRPGRVSPASSLSPL